MKSSTATRYLITLSAADWCDPAAGIYNGCNPDDREGYKISNIVFATVNLAASLLLLVMCIIRLRMVETRPSVFFVTASLIMFNTIFIAMWCILREVPSSPPWLTAAMFTGGGMCTVSGIDYLLLIYREKQTIKNMLIYEGLKVYRRRWILYCITSFFCFALYPVSYAIGPLGYNVANRAFWFWFSIMMVYSVGGGVHYALKIRRHSAQVNRMAIWMIIILVPGIMCTSLATISPVIINKTFWLWIAFYSVMQSAMVGVALLLAMWAFTVTRQRIKEKSFSSSLNPQSKHSSSKETATTTDDIGSTSVAETAATM